jgi:hypothetical protein
LEFEAALILLGKSKINRGDSREMLLRPERWACAGRRRVCAPAVF